MDALTELGRPYIPVNFSGKADDKRYYNKRAEMYFLAAEWVKRGGALPNLPDLTREATTPTYTFKGNRFLIEDKDQIKDRLGFSPDLWDAFVLTFAFPVVKGIRDTGRVRTMDDEYGGGVGHVHTEFDPYARMEV